MKAFILETLIEYNEQINSLYKYIYLNYYRMPTKVVPNLSIKYKNITLNAAEISGQVINIMVLSVSRDYFRREKLLSFLALLL